MSNHEQAGSPRPAVSVLMPFLGDEEEAARALNALCRIERRAGDEIVVADNCPDQIMRAIASRWPGVRAVPAAEERSAYYARNVAGAAASNEWFLFTDADCLPAPDILERYFAEPVAADVGAIAGEVFGDPNQTEVIARYQRDRGYLNQERYVRSPRPYAVTANLLVRADAWRSVGGFLEGVSCDADTDFTWRLQAAGWRLGYRHEASVTHSYRDTARAFARMVISYAAGRAWLNRRYPGAYPERRSPLAIPRALAGALRWSLTGDCDRARFRAIDAMVIVLDAFGLTRPNSTAEVARDQADHVVVANEFPTLGERSEGQEGVRFEAAHRPGQQDLQTFRRSVVHYWEDDTELTRLRALARLVRRRPVRCAADFRARRGGRTPTTAAAPPLRVLAPSAVRLLSGSPVRVVALDRDAVHAADRLSRVTGVALGPAPASGRQGDGALG